ncbi:adenylyl-sulfate kinase [Geomonas sp. Red32]|uniref:adenylyl-sulfate kinase n=1 Tax=Geomonas sp. Red32 TaxID=2912856 RepID=UPI00202CE6DE|nr:adenylyl-sulfate kinase [Geomonas sp. Red32]MCM0081386.1 adenylyl-sulfate kinase [Geomonas sp. Red32]
MTAPLNNLNWHQHWLKRRQYRERNGHAPRLLWFTGLSGSGKSTLARAVEERLFARGWYTYLLDGDHLRYGLNNDLGFSAADRKENIRRVGEVARLMVEAGLVVHAAFISPFAEDRDRVRSLLPPGQFVEIYLKCPLDVCELRDPKDLYRKARAGEIPEFTGIDSPYEEPPRPELVIDTSRTDLDRSVATILNYLDGR